MIDGLRLRGHASIAVPEHPSAACALAPSPLLQPLPRSQHWPNTCTSVQRIRESGREACLAHEFVGVKRQRVLGALDAHVHQRRVGVHVALDALGLHLGSQLQGGEQKGSSGAGGVRPAGGPTRAVQVAGRAAGILAEQAARCEPVACAGSTRVVSMQKQSCGETAGAGRVPTSCRPLAGAPCQYRPGCKQAAAP